jgi:hypothetical protein
MTNKKKCNDLDIYNGIFLQYNYKKIDIGGALSCRAARAALSCQLAYHRAAARHVYDDYTHIRGVSIIAVHHRQSSRL